GIPINLAGVDGAAVVNNTAYDSGLAGMWSAFNMTSKGNPEYFQNSHVQVWNNIFNRMTIGGGSLFPEYCGYNIIWPGGISSPDVDACGDALLIFDPQFIGHATYELGALSPAIDSGSGRAGTPAYDLDGVAYGIP